MNFVKRIHEFFAHLANPLHEYSFDGVGHYEDYDGEVVAIRKINDAKQPDRFDFAEITVRLENGLELDGFFYHPDLPKTGYHAVIRIYKIMPLRVLGWEYRSMPGNRIIAWSSTLEYRQPLDKREIDRFKIGPQREPVSRKDMS